MTNAADYTAWANNFGMIVTAPKTSAAAVVPHPSTFALLLITALGLIAARRWFSKSTSRSQRASQSRKLNRLLGRLVNRVCRESCRSPVGANPTRPIGRSAGSNQGDAGGNKCVEVLWCNGSLLGDLATMQAGT